MEMTTAATIYEPLVAGLTKLLNDKNIEAGHGINHARAVADHCIEAVKHFPLLPEWQRVSIVLAGFLHDADDKKFFQTTDYQNARDILAAAEYTGETIDLVIKMIGLVACSTNRNDSGDATVWELIPRYCDRLEALGEIGIERCIDYSKHKGMPMYFTASLAFSVEEVMAKATPERFAAYTGASISMIDHFYDKLLHLSVDTGVPYIDRIMKERHLLMIEWVAAFGRSHRDF